MLKKAINFRSMLLVFVILFTIVIVSKDTYSQFEAFDTVKNHHESAMLDLQIEVIDEFTPPDGYIPGDTVNKQVGAKNTGTLPSFVRLMVFPTIISSDGVTPLPANIGQEVIIPDLDTTKWMYGGDGYYYYLDVLQPGDTTIPSLFKTVKIADNLASEYNDSHLKIEVKAEGSLINKYKYRDAFWQGQTPSSDPLQTIDSIFEGKAQ